VASSSANKAWEGRRTGRRTEAWRRAALAGGRRREGGGSGGGWRKVGDQRMKEETGEGEDQTPGEGAIPTNTELGGSVLSYRG
jgi:hypothetical protein